MHGCNVSINNWLPFARRSCPKNVALCGRRDNPSRPALRWLNCLTLLPTFLLLKLGDGHRVGAPFAGAEELHYSVVQVKVEQADRGGLASVFEAGSLQKTDGVLPALTEISKE